MYPKGQGGHTPPTAGALLSIHAALLKHEMSLQPSASFSQNSPSKAMLNKKILIVYFSVKFISIYLHYSHREI